MNPFISRSLDETIRCGENIGRSLEGGEVLILSGQLGSGKTVLAKGIAAGLGVQDTVTSPSFAILNVYSGRLDLYHFDFYRLSRAAELGEIGFDEYASADGVCLIEWGTLFLEHLPPQTKIIRFRDRGNGVREIDLPS